MQIYLYFGKKIIEISYLEAEILKKNVFRGFGVFFYI